MFESAESVLGGFLYVDVYVYVYVGVVTVVASVECARRVSHMLYHYDDGRKTQTENLQ